MRLDKYLKVSRLIKRRTVANEACDGGRVMINDKVAKASAEVKPGDVITISFGNKEVKVEVLDVQETVRIVTAAELFRYLLSGFGRAGSISPRSLIYCIQITERGWAYGGFKRKRTYAQGVHDQSEKLHGRRRERCAFF